MLPLFFWVEYAALRDCVQGFEWIPDQIPRSRPLQEEATAIRWLDCGEDVRLAATMVKIFCCIGSRASGHWLEPLRGRAWAWFDTDHAARTARAISPHLARFAEFS
jgi:hypothetical protein